MELNLYTEAKKKVAAQKAKENYMAFKFALDYDSYILLPNKAAVELMSALANAEVLTKAYNQRPSIGPVGPQLITAHNFSAIDYERYRIAAMLNIHPDELLQFETPPITITP